MAHSIGSRPIAKIEQHFGSGQKGVAYMNLLFLYPLGDMLQRSTIGALFASVFAQRAASFLPRSMRSFAEFPA